MSQRLTYRRRHSYNTKSNKRKISKTPGGRNVLLYKRKGGKVPVCGDTGVRLHGIKRLRPTQLARVSKRQKTTRRAYGGVLSGNAVRERIIRAFLTEEQKIINKVMKAQKKTAAAGAK